MQEVGKEKVPWQKMLSVGLRVSMYYCIEP